jgi:hypothetical protein
MTLNTTQNALLKAMEARMFDPIEVSERDAEHVTITGYRPEHAELASGTIIGLTAHWSPVASESFVLVARKSELTATAGYREVMAELKTGQRAETAEQRVREHLGGVFVDQTTTTKEEQADERAFNAATRAVAKAQKDAAKRERDRVRAEKAAAKEAAAKVRPGIGEDVSEDPEYIAAMQQQDAEIAADQAAALAEHYGRLS